MLRFRQKPPQWGQQGLWAAALRQPKSLRENIDNLDRHAEDEVRQFEQAVAESPQIVSCCATTGAADCVNQVLVAAIQGYERFLHDTAFKLSAMCARGWCCAS